MRDTLLQVAAIVEDGRHWLLVAETVVEGESRVQRVGGALLAELPTISVSSLFFYGVSPIYSSASLSIH